MSRQQNAENVSPCKNGRQRIALIRIAHEVGPGHSMIRREAMCGLVPDSNFDPALYRVWVDGPEEVGPQSGSSGTVGNHSDG